LPVTAHSRSQAPLHGLRFGVGANGWRPKQRGAFVQEPSVTLIISGRAPEMARRPRATPSEKSGQEGYRQWTRWTEVAKQSRSVESAGGTTVRAHRNCRGRRLAGRRRERPRRQRPAGRCPGGRRRRGDARGGTGGLAVGGDTRPGRPAQGRGRRGPGADRRLVTAFATESAERAQARIRPLCSRPDQLRGAVLWDSVPGKPSRLPGNAAHTLHDPAHLRTSAASGQTATADALANLTRPRRRDRPDQQSTPMPERRHNG